MRTLTDACWVLAIGWVGVGIAAFVYAWLSKRRFGLFNKGEPEREALIPPKILSDAAKAIGQAGKNSTKQA